MVLQKEKDFSKLGSDSQQKQKHPIRILHVVGGMNRGGVETWLMHILRRIDRDQFQMDFLVHTTESCAYDDEIRALGSRIIPCLYPSNPLQYASNFKRLLKEYGPYDIIHSHVHHFSGYVLRLAHQAGIPIRISHSHLDSAPLEVNAKWYRRLYFALSKSWIKQHATLGLGCSELAVVDLFGSTWRTNPDRQILYYGIDLAPFQSSVNPSAVRAELGIPSDAFVVGHVGRFDIQKNHTFLVEIAAEIVQRNPKTFFLLIGEGVLRPIIEQQVAQRGLTNQFIFAGSRSDVPRLMRGAMDMFLLPSLCEGLPVVLIEAQAAGLPCLFSDAITEEANIIQPFILRLSLSKAASEWAEVALLQRNRVTLTPSEALEILETSPFNIEVSLKQLETAYQTQILQAAI